MMSVQFKGKTMASSSIYTNKVYIYICTYIYIFMCVCVCIINLLLSSWQLYFLWLIVVGSNKREIDILSDDQRYYLF